MGLGLCSSVFVRVHTVTIFGEKIRPGRLGEKGFMMVRGLGVQTRTMYLKQQLKQIPDALFGIRVVSSKLRVWDLF